MATAIEPSWHNQRVTHESAIGGNCGESETTVCENNYGKRCACKRTEGTAHGNPRSGTASTNNQLHRVLSA